MSIIAHQGQRFGYYHRFMECHHRYVRSCRHNELHRVIEQRWLDRLGGKYVRHTFMPGNAGNGREVWRNGHQRLWYWRWIGLEPDDDMPAPKPPAEMSWTGPMKLAA